MSSVAIRADNLGKQYLIAPGKGRRWKYRTFRETLAGAVRRGCRALRPSFRPSAGETPVWALRNLSFEVRHGEVLGIIGRNGAGKSTLLKILSRITEPTEGRGEVHGRIGSLLEVGTGFHPELSGRDNIFLNGAILGMRRSEIRRKFDAIVAFAGVEQFLDTPVKRYSSGMYMRLAFSVAAHLEPDILVVDEVLAVGDAEFQKKCLGKMDDIARDGRTVLFVSHNMAAIRRLCTRAILLDGGRLVADSSPPHETMAVYAGFTGQRRSEWVRTDGRGRGSGEMTFTRIGIELQGEQPGHELIVTAEVVSRKAHAPAFMRVDVLDSLSARIMQAVPSEGPFLTHNRGRQCVRIGVSLPPLVPGVYRVLTWAGPNHAHSYDEVDPGLSFTITDSPSPGRTSPYNIENGCIVPRSRLMSWVPE